MATICPTYETGLALGAILGGLATGAVWWAYSTIISSYRVGEVRSQREVESRDGPSSEDDDELECDLCGGEATSGLRCYERCSCGSESCRNGCDFVVCKTCGFTEDMVLKTIEHDHILVPFGDLYEDEDVDDDDEDDSDDDEGSDDDVVQDLGISAAKIRKSDSTKKRNKVSFRLTNEAFIAMFSHLERMHGVVTADGSNVVAPTAEPMMSTSPLASTPPQPEQVVHLNAQEVAEIFAEEEARHNQTQKEVLDKGRKVKAQPRSLHTSVGGGYVTMSTLEDTSKEHDQWKTSGVLSRGDELEIIHIFRGIVGMTFRDASAKAAEQNYKIHALYVSAGPKMPLLTGYSGTTIGVRIKDPDFDYDNHAPSQTAIVSEIIDVGGVDLKNRGAVSL